MTTTDLVRGATVWSRKLHWGLASGDMIRWRYGVAIRLPDREPAKENGR